MAVTDGSQLYDQQDALGVPKSADEIFESSLRPPAPRTRREAHPEERPVAAGQRAAQLEKGPEEGLSSTGRRNGDSTRSH